MILCHWIRKTKDYPTLFLASQTQSHHWLENWKNHLERFLIKLSELGWKEKANFKDNDGRTIQQRRRKESHAESYQYGCKCYLHGVMQRSQHKQDKHCYQIGHWRKQKKTGKELVPEEYHKYLDIFSKEKAAQFPKPKPWDHMIKMKEGFKPKSFKDYNLTPVEQLEFNKFLKENLDKDTFDHQNLPWHHHSFLFLRKMKNSNHAKIIDTLMIGWSRTPILYHQFQT